MKKIFLMILLLPGVTLASNSLILDDVTCSRISGFIEDINNELSSDLQLQVDCQSISSGIPGLIEYNFRAQIHLSTDPTCLINSEPIELAHKIYLGNRSEEKAINKILNTMYIKINSVAGKDAAGYSKNFMNKITFPNCM